MNITAWFEQRVVVDRTGKQGKQAGELPEL